MTEHHPPKAVVLLNLGSPISPTPHDVRVYLDQFLNDPYVIDLPWLFRKILVNGIILNTRPAKTAAAYQKIWSEQGSPLIEHTRLLTEKIKSKIKMPAVYCMRYGSPSIEDALRTLKTNDPTSALKEIVFLPLYPQYSYAATESSIVEFQKLQKKIIPYAQTRVIEDFYDHPDFIDSVSELITPVWNSANADLLLLSYHGIPERQIAKIKECPTKCCSPGCCDQITKQNSKCYKAQCYETSRLIAKKLNLPISKYFVSFQSRLGRTKWIEPYTDLILKELPQKGIKRIVVASPSFTADCLETLEEIKIRYRELFLSAGGESFEYIPCVNSSDSFVNTVLKLIS